MSRDPRRACQMAALALGMYAKVGPVWRPEVADLVLLAVVLEEADTLREACFTFARTACCVGGVKRLAEAGEELRRAVERSTWPDVPLQ